MKGFVEFDTTWGKHYVRADYVTCVYDTFQFVGENKRGRHEGCVVVSLGDYGGGKTLEGVKAEDAIKKIDAFLSLDTDKFNELKRIVSDLTGDSAK